MLPVSRKHKNRRAYNWLIYDIGDRFLWKYRGYYRGILYDLGCGEAPYREYFMQYADNYIGVDWAQSVHTIKADIVADLNKSLPIESDVADTVVSLSVLEHLCEPQNLLNEAHRILRPGSAIVFQVPWQWWIHEAPYDYFRYTPYGLKYMFEKAGFVDIEIYPQAGFFTTSILKTNYFTRRFIRGPKVIRWMLQGMLIPFWYLGQILAPYLDKLDRNWAAEACGYYVTAKKP